MKKPTRDKHAVEGPPPIKVSVPIAKPLPAKKHGHPIGNLGSWAHPPKKKAKK